MHTELDLSSFTTVYQDADMVAIHKPAGLLVHRSPIDRHETQFAVQMTRDRIGQDVYPIHRLDKATSGLLLFALSPEIARNLGAQFSEHTIHKTYVALCRGWAAASGTIDHALLYKKDRIADKHKQEPTEPQSAVTHFETLATTTLDQPIGRYAQQRYSLLKLSPETGRKHQLRRHLNHISHPIIGDVKYGDRHHNHLFHEWLGQHRLYLAATSLCFIHPATQQPITIDAPLENSFCRALDALNILDAVPQT
ncbi:pseudouridine synthase [Thiomicrorhabdus cannonii]|uniref:pseudouridine synthase n=1 Tax=Thiomicrorhabdus cannonii TaxID=2748011 RepID=UPI0015BFD4B9|nr:pseudouridine synthase [Thiomicrorhabdus cannonii]